MPVDEAEDAAPLRAPTHDLVAADALAELRKMKEEAAAAAKEAEPRQRLLMEKIAELEKNAATQVEADQNTPTASPAQEHADCNIKVAWDMGSVPIMETPPEKILPIFGLIYDNLNLWSQSGSFPVTYAQLYRGCDRKLLDPIETSKTLVGPAIWKLYYGERAVKDLFFVPFQMISILSFALGKVAAALTADAKRAELQSAKDSKMHFTMLAEKDARDRATAAGAYGASPY
jgi:hypothetical protein